MRLNVDESNYFPTALAQECDPIETTSNEMGVLPAMPADPAYMTGVCLQMESGILLNTLRTILAVASSNSSRLVGWAEHVAAEQEQEVANQQDQFDYSSNDDDYVLNKSSSISSSDESGDNVSSIGDDSPGRYPTRSTRNANPNYKPTKGFHAALTSIMGCEACRMAGVNPNNTTSATAAKAILLYFSYATFMNDEKTSMPEILILIAKQPGLSTHVSSTFHTSL